MTPDRIREVIERLERFRPFDCGDDPVLWSQSDTVDRIKEFLAKELL